MSEKQLTFEGMEEFPMSPGDSGKWLKISGKHKTAHLKQDGKFLCGVAAKGRTVDCPANENDKKCGCCEENSGTREFHRDLAKKKEIIRQALGKSCPGCGKTSVFNLTIDLYDVDFSCLNCGEAEASFFAIDRRAGEHCGDDSYLAAFMEIIKTEITLPPVPNISDWRRKKEIRKEENQADEDVRRELDQDLTDESWREECRDMIDSGRDFAREGDR